MIKKILFYICVLISFFVMFFFVFDKINTLAYSDMESTIGSYPVKLDIDNYNNENLISLPNKQGSERNLNYTIENGIITLNGTTNSEGNVIMINNLGLELKANTTYSYKGFVDNVGDITGTTLFIGVGEWSNNYNDTIMIVLNYDEGNSITPLEDIVINYVHIYVVANQTYNNLIIKPMLVEGNNIPNNFSAPLIFGYNVHYNLALKNNLSYGIDAGISLYSGNNLLTSSSCYIPANSSEICESLNNKIYLPFNIDNNGYIGFNHNLTLRVGPVDSITISDGGLAFESVFSAYYKGEKTDYLYFKQTYTFNNIFLSGFSVSSNENSNITFVTTDFDKPFNIASNNEYNVSTNKKTSVIYTDKFNYNEFITTSTNNIYDFAIVVSDLNNGSNYNISISTLMTRVVGDSGANAPLPGDSDIINKYNECSAWYDIPCQFGNGLTYIIYEAPIISPVLTFIVSFITMFSSLVSFVDLFKTFGIVFGCFIIYMFIELLHKYSK